MGVLHPCRTLVCRFVASTWGFDLNFLDEVECGALWTAARWNRGSWQPGSLHQVLLLEGMGIIAQGLGGRIGLGGLQGPWVPACSAGTGTAVCMHRVRVVAC